MATHQREWTFLLLALTISYGLTASGFYVLITNLNNAGFGGGMVLIIIGSVLSIVFTVVSISTYCSQPLSKVTPNQNRITPAEPEDRPNSIVFTL
jgi:hypothetical protein